MYGTAISYLATWVITVGYPEIALGFIMLQFCGSCLISLFIYEDLKRLKAGKKDIEDAAGRGTLGESDIAALDKLDPKTRLANSLDMDEDEQ